MPRKWFVVAWLVAGLAGWATAGDGGKRLTAAQGLFDQGEDWLSSLPAVQGWADGGHYFELRDKRLFRVAAASGAAALVWDQADAEAALGDGDFRLSRALDQTPEQTRFLFRRNGDIALFDLSTRHWQTLAAGPGEEHNPLFSPDGRRIAFTRAGDMYVHDLTTERTTRLTTDGSEEILNGYASWVYYEEILGRRCRYRAFWWSPDGDRLVFMRFDQRAVPVFHIVGSEGDYGRVEKQYYPKPGYPNPAVRLGIVHVATGQVEWIPFADPADHYLAFPAWSPAGEAVFFQWMNRGQDHLRVLRYDLKTKALRVVYEEKQPAWVECFDANDWRILADESLIIRSSADGWYHLYRILPDGNRQQLTRGEWSAAAIETLDDAETAVFFTAYREHPARRDLYRLDLKTQAIRRLTEFAGTHTVQVAPGGAWFTDEYSSVSTPPRLELRSGDGRRIRMLGDARTETLAEYHLGRAELFTITTGDGVTLPARWLLPPDFDPARKYPVLFRIYGGPGSRSVSDSFPRRSEFYYVQQGMILFTVDHRGAGHHGKRGMALMHRRLGHWEMHDYGEAVKYLRTLPFVEAEAMAIRGGSYGGYATALALTRGNEFFRYGIASSSVMDWRLYDSVYTERYMDTPAENPDGYTDASVLTYLERYRGGLRVTHGTMDDNVHLQNTLQFLDALLATGQTVELMIYPGERHGWSRSPKHRESALADLNFLLQSFFGRTISLAEPSPER
ncbi:MAG: DPP IV N-terminal domain-containing protein [Acidobacteria bacterium]|nr:DPP IV N-terminal domain-containing protein [Acidobacteriota bacterium]